MSGDSKPTTRYQPNDEIFAEHIDRMNQVAEFCGDSLRAQAQAGDDTGAQIYSNAFSSILDHMHAIRHHEQR